MVTVSRYDAHGNLVGYHRVGFGAPRARRRPGCLTVFFAIVIFLWPVGIIGKSIAGTLVGVLWFGSFLGLFVYVVARSHRAGERAQRIRAEAEAAVKLRRAEALARMGRELTAVELDAVSTRIWERYKRDPRVPTTDLRNSV